MIAVEHLNMWKLFTDNSLPVEMDASFNKALPILEEGYLAKEDLPGARKVLKAAAGTYVAAALASLLNIGRWIAILRR
ncbi:zinc metallopeptidase, partial [Endozoicomonas sp. ONNA2]|uniref:zinc metallopeptidase n=1 Tax=Endozoicomonas sp. ONNA2 TaxID=2828741 RepID=UPI0021472DD1